MSSVLQHALILVIALLSYIPQSAWAQRRDIDRDWPENWEPLGCENVGRREDRDVIRVGRREGRFRAIRLSAVGNDVHIEDLRVIYGNGKPDDIRVRSELREGSQTRPLDLEGRDRFIDRIELTTKRGYKGRGRGRAKICVFGLPDAWEQLGCQKVGFRADRDVIRVGRREGRFGAIRLEASGNAVFFMNLRVIYANGAPDDIPVRLEMRDGGQSGPLPLKERGRAIDRIELFYRAKPNFKGSARVCVAGRK